MTRRIIVVRPHQVYSHSFLLTYSIEQSPSLEANWFCSQARNSPHFLHPKVPHRTHKCPPPVPILTQLHQIPTTPSNFPKIHPNIILPSTSGSPQWSLSLRFPYQNPVHTSSLPHTRHMPRPSQSSRFYHPHILIVTLISINLIFTIKLFVSAIVRNCINKIHLFIIVTLSLPPSSHECQPRSVSEPSLG